MSEGKLCPLTQNGDLSSACVIDSCAMYFNGSCGLAAKISEKVAERAAERLSEVLGAGRGPVLAAGAAPLPIDGTASLDDIISDILLDCGVKTHVRGYRYLRQAIAMAVDDPSATSEMIRKVYAGVAEANGTTPSRAERAMRHAIEAMFATPTRRLEEIFRNSCDAKGCATNGQFVSTVADYISRRRTVQE